MGKLTFVISDDLNLRFRAMIFKRFGYRKGNIKRALEEAVELWIKKTRTKLRS